MSPYSRWQIFFSCTNHHHWQTSYTRFTTATAYRHIHFVAQNASVWMNICPNNLIRCRLLMQLLDNSQNSYGRFSFFFLHFLLFASLFANRRFVSNDISFGNIKHVPDIKFGSTRIFMSHAIHPVEWNWNGIKR